MSKPLSDDALQIVFDFASVGQLAAVCKKWKSIYETHLFTQWHALEGTANPELRYKMGLAIDRSGPTTIPRRFQDLSALLEEVSPNRDQARIILRNAPTPSSGFKNEIQKAMSVCCSCFAPTRPLLQQPHHESSPPKKVVAKGIVPTLLEKQEIITRYNRERLGDVNRQLEEKFSEGALKNIKKLVDSWSKTHGLFLNHLGLTEFPISWAKFPLKALSMWDNPRLCRLPIRIMENLFLRRLCLDNALYRKLPVNLRNHIEKQVRLERCKFENEQEASLGWDAYDHGVHHLRRFGQTPVTSPLAKQNYGVVSIAMKEHRGPTLFYDEMCYKPVSALGVLYQAAYQEKPASEIMKLYANLSQDDKMHFSTLYMRGQNNYWGLLFFDDMGLLCRFINRILVEKANEDNQELFAIVRKLGENQSPKDPFWAKDDADWGKTHCLVNKGRLADAIMYLETGEPIPSASLDDEKKKDTE